MFLEQKVYEIFIENLASPLSLVLTFLNKKGVSGTR